MRLNHRKPEAGRKAALGADSSALETTYDLTRRHGPETIICIPLMRLSQVVLVDSRDDGKVSNEENLPRISPIDAEEEEWCQRGFLVGVSLAFLFDSPNLRRSGNLRMHFSPPLSTRQSSWIDSASPMPFFNDLIRRPRVAWIAVLVVIGVVGCGGSAPTSPFERYVPAPEQARRAVDAVLSAWRDTADPQPGLVTAPGTRFVDHQRKPGQRLKSFEILGVRKVENALQIAVALTLDPPAEGQEPADAAPSLVRYNVYGVDPVWVFRLEDYEMISHWEHEMKDPAETSTPPPASSPAR
jgi:hypothetical protein